MAHKCAYCGKDYDYGHNVSHAKNRTRRIRKPNTHSVRVVEAGATVRRLLCTSCLRSAKRPHEAKLKPQQA